jgi:hypothetical protein
MLASTTGEKTVAIRKVITVEREVSFFIGTAPRK